MPGHRFHPGLSVSSWRHQVGFQLGYVYNWPTPRDSYVTFQILGIRSVASGMVTESRFHFRAFVMREGCCCPSSWFVLVDENWVNLRSLDDEEPAVFEVSSASFEKQLPVDTSSSGSNFSDYDKENIKNSSMAVPKPDLTDMKAVIQELATIEGSSLDEQEAQLEEVLNSTLDTDADSDVSLDEEKKEDDEKHGSKKPAAGREEPTETTEASDASFAEISEVETDGGEKSGSSSLDDPSEQGGDGDMWSDVPLDAIEDVHSDNEASSPSLLGSEVDEEEPVKSAVALEPAASKSGGVEGETNDGASYYSASSTVSAAQRAPKTPTDQLPVVPSESSLCDNNTTTKNGKESVGAPKSSKTAVTRSPDQKPETTSEEKSSEVQAGAAIVAPPEVGKRNTEDASKVEVTAVEKANSAPDSPVAPTAESVEGAKPENETTTNEETTTTPVTDKSSDGEKVAADQTAGNADSEPATEGKAAVNKNKEKTDPEPAEKEKAVANQTDNKAGPALAVEEEGATTPGLQPKGEDKVQAILARLSTRSPDRTTPVAGNSKQGASARSSPDRASTPVSDTPKDEPVIPSPPTAELVKITSSGGESATTVLTPLSRKGRSIAIVSSTPQDVVPIGDIVDTISPMPTKSFESSGDILKVPSLDSAFLPKEAVADNSTQSTNTATKKPKNALQQELEAKFAKKAKEATAAAAAAAAEGESSAPAVTPKRPQAATTAPKQSPPVQAAATPVAPRVDLAPKVPQTTTPIPTQNKASPPKPAPIQQVPSSSSVSSTSKRFPKSPPKKSSAFKPKSLSQVIRQDLWSPDSEIVAQALQWITIEAFHDDEARGKIARAGGLLAIVRCMDQHAGDAAVQRAACQSLEKLALSTDNELAINDVGGVEAVLNAMMGHLENASVQEAAWSALQNLTCQNARERMSVDTEGGMDALVSAMKGHLDDPQVQLGAAGTMANLCLQNETRMSKLAAAGGIVALATALERHWDDENFRKETGRAMADLLSDLHS